jgi:hypothetical protein
MNIFPELHSSNVWTKKNYLFPTQISHFLISTRLIPHVTNWSSGISPENYSQ